jgi:hypothetical protein
MKPETKSEIYKNHVRRGLMGLALWFALLGIIAVGTARSYIQPDTFFQLWNYLLNPIFTFSYFYTCWSIAKMKGYNGLWGFIGLAVVLAGTLWLKQFAWAYAFLLLCALMHALASQKRTEPELNKFRR